MKKKELIELLERKLKHRIDEMDGYGRQSSYINEYNKGFNDAMDAVREFPDE